MRCPPKTLVLVGLLWACAPALDWRQVSLGDWQVNATFPCRPSNAQRDLDLGGRRTTMFLHACTASDTTFALAMADVGDVRSVAPALSALTATAVRNLAARIDSDQPAQVPGMTPNSEARRLRLTGHLPDGRTAIEHVAVFAHGSRVYQLALVGSQPAADAIQVFFDGVRLTP